MRTRSSAGDRRHSRSRTSKRAIGSKRKERRSTTTSKGDVTVNVDGNTKITKQGKTIALADIKTGDRVEAEGDAGRSDDLERREDLGRGEQHRPRRSLNVIPLTFPGRGRCYTPPPTTEVFARGAYRTPPFYFPGGTKMRMARCAVVVLAVVALAGCRDGESVSGVYGAGVVSGQVVMAAGTSASPAGVRVSVVGTGMS